MTSAINSRKHLGLVPVTEWDNARNPLDTSFPVHGEVGNGLSTCCGLVSDTANYLDMSRCRQQVRNKFATSRCNGIWETTRHNRHNGLLPAPTCYGLVTDLRLVTHGVMDFGLNSCRLDSMCPGVMNSASLYFGIVIIILSS